MRGSATSGSWAHHRRAGVADLAEWAIDVGDRVAVTADFGLLRRSAAELRLSADRRGDRMSERSPVGCEVSFRVVSFDQQVATSGLEAQERSIAVEVLAPASEVSQRIEELAVVGATGAELIFDRLVESRGEDPGGAEADPVELGQGNRLAGLGGAGEAGGRFAQELGNAATLLAGEERAGLLDPGLAGGDPFGKLGDGGRQLDRPGAQRRRGEVGADQGAVG